VINFISYQLRRTTLGFGEAVETPFPQVLGRETAREAKSTSELTADRNDIPVCNRIGRYVIQIPSLKHQQRIVGCEDTTYYRSERSGWRSLNGAEHFSADIFIREIQS
jgi:hypothetical protein